MAEHHELRCVFGHGWTQQNMLFRVGLACLVGFAGAQPNTYFLLISGFSWGVGFTLFYAILRYFTLFDAISFWESLQGFGHLRFWCLPKNGSSPGMLARALFAPTWLSLEIPNVGVSTDIRSWPVYFSSEVRRRDAAGRKWHKPNEHLGQRSSMCLETLRGYYSHDRTRDEPSYSR